MRSRAQYSKTSGMCVLHGIFPRQNIETMCQRSWYMKPVVYLEKVEEYFFNSCSSKEEYFSKLAENHRQVQAEMNRVFYHVTAGPHSMIPPQPQPPFNQETAIPSAGSYPSSSTMMDGNSSMPLSSGDEVDQREFVNRYVQRTIEVLVHASQCKDRNCKNRPCMKMKQVIFHAHRCRSCPFCNQFVQLCLQHAKQCMDEECAVPLCANLKKRIEERQRESQINQKVNAEENEGDAE